MYCPYYLDYSYYLPILFSLPEGLNATSVGSYGETVNSFWHFMVYKWDILKRDDHFNTESVKCDHLKPALQGCNETSKTLKRLLDLSNLQTWLHLITSNMYTHAYILGGRSRTFYKGSISCDINKAHICDQLSHSPLKPQQGAGQLG